MLDIKTLNEVIINVINNIHDSVPEADTKEGTFLRDVIIDPTSKEFADIYDDLYKLELSQSVLTATGNSLDRLAGNYFIERKAGTKSYGKVRFYIANTDQSVAPDFKYSDIRIPLGAMITTQGTLDNQSLQFQTIDDVFIKGTSETVINGTTTLTSGIQGLPRDATGYRYVEIMCESIDTGVITNIGPYEIIAQVGSTIDSIINVSNPYSFSGGSDPEDDISLALRVSLAITGSNIGTKDGYLSYILQQTQVLDALVVGAGDEYMTRDIETVISKTSGNQVTQHMGGKVDIYVRTNSQSQDEFTYTITSEDLNNDFKVPRHVLFPNNSYPIERVVSIVGQVINIDKSVTYKTYVNADDYELEKRTDDKELYYIDIPWDFSIKTSFPDSEYYPLPANLTSDDIIRLKTKLDNELQIAMQYMQNISYKIEWNFLEWIKVDNSMFTNPEDSTTLFDYGKYTDNLFYKIRMRSDVEDGAILGGRVFIKKEDKIFIRSYVTPDFKLVRDSSEFAGSVKARDYVQWFQKSEDPNDINKIHIPVEYEKLVIKYITNSGIKELQDGIETKRVLTADVLIKAAKRRDVEIRLYVICSTSYDPEQVRLKVNDALTYYVNTQKKLGDYLDESDIVYIAKSIDGVISVDMDTISLGFVGVVNTQLISCKPDEYFYLKNLILSVTNTFVI